MVRIIKSSLCMLLVVLILSCGSKPAEENHLVTEIESIKEAYAPDKRVALFSVEAEKQGNTYLLKGESNLSAAVDALKANLTAAKLKFIDSIQHLPSKVLGDKTLALVNISVANLRSNPKHSAELATQATLGTPLKVYKKEGTWFLVQTPDNYLSWVDDGGIRPINQTEFDQWINKTKIIFTKMYGNTYSKPNKESEVVSDIVAGSILGYVGEENDFYKVVYPDHREAFVYKDEVQLYEEWLSQTKPSGDHLVSTSKKLMGLPYLWGGTSSKGVDCSGFTKTIYFLNGIILPRDASQQVHTGDQIDDAQDFENLQAGDLLFFGTKATDTSKEKVVHVGMWIGNNEFIHASGRVQINSVDKNAPNFDSFNLNRYLRSKRVLNSTTGSLLHLTKTPLFIN